MECKGWHQEAALRCLRNNLHPDVAERPADLVVYGGNGKAARDHAALAAIERTLMRLEDDQTLLVQSGKPVAVFRTFAHAPRVLIANSLLVPDWATWPDFWELEALGLTMYGQMTAGSWIYIGTQGIVQGTFQTFAALAEQRYDGTLRGRVILTSGLGGMGGAQPLAVTMNGGAALCLDVDPARVQRRLATRYLDEVAESVADGLHRVRTAAAAGRPLSVGVVANAADALPALLAAGESFDVVTDQTSAHDPLNGYVPAGLSLAEAAELRTAQPAQYVAQARASMVEHCRAMVGFGRAGAEVFDYGNNLRGEAREAGLAEAFDYPGFVPAYIRPLFCEGIGPFRFVALSGRPEDIAVADEALLAAFPANRYVQRWIPLARDRISFQGLPARICWLGYGERAEAGELLNSLVGSGRLSAPVVIGRDHLDSGSVASPYRETEAMADGSDAVADWPILNALLNVASGASWVAVHHGGGVGMGKSIHAGAQVLADGTADAELRISRVLTNDPGTGVVRHADAGYEIAQRVATERGIDMPMLWGSLLVTGIGQLVTWDPEQPIRSQAALVVDDGRVAWVGSSAVTPVTDERLDVDGATVIPGFVDSHTHLVFGGDRAAEYEARLAGTPYAAGGIRTTVAATRALPTPQLRVRATRLAAEALRSGTTTLEIKSGYGLTVLDELRSLEVAATLTPHRTFLGAHVVPADTDAASYVDLVTGPMLDAVAGVATAVDAFCEHGAFDADQCRVVLQAGAQRGLAVHVHANQLRQGPGVQLAAELGALSAGHCTFLSEADVSALRDAGVVAVLVPAAEFCTRTGYAPARRLLDAGVSVALATDCNPGTSYTTSMAWVMALACREQGLTAEEALRAATVGGAAALGQSDIGHLTVGARADLVVLEAPSFVHLVYRPGVDLVRTVLRRGEVVR